MSDSVKGRRTRGGFRKRLGEAARAFGEKVLVGNEAEPPDERRYDTGTTIRRKPRKREKLTKVVVDFLVAPRTPATKVKKSNVR